MDFVNGLDANNGLGPDASHASNKPWKTVTKLLGAAGMASGDTAYLSPAGPFRETVVLAMTSAVAETKIIGDYANSRGFKTSGGVAVAPGPVIVTGYTTNDKTAPSATTLLSLVGRDFLTFQNIMFIGGNATMLTSSTVTSTNITFTDCSFMVGRLASLAFAAVTIGFGVNSAWLFDRCLFVGGAGNNGLTFTCTRGTGADYDINVVFKNSTFLFTGGNAMILVTSTGAGANFGNGVDLVNCSVFGACGAAALNCQASISTTIPSTVNNCFFWGQSAAALQANGAGQITENFNLFACASARTNVTAGANSIADGSYAPLFQFGQELKYGASQRHFMEPMASSPLLGFGNDGNQTAYDLRNKLRPAGGVSASAGIGSMERGNTWTKETGTVHTGSNAITVTGPGYQEFLVPVSASSTTISVFFQYDATYAGTRPQIQVDANGEIGVSAETITVSTSALSAWAQASLSALTPSATGIVTVRVISNDTNGGGKVYADTFAVA